MRAVIQRVAAASVEVDGETVGAIGHGLLVFLGIMEGDSAAERSWLAGRIPQIRCFGDAEGRMNRSVRDVGGGILVISQFTLLGELRKGTRPSFNRAAAPAQAIPYYEAFLAEISAALGRPVASGRFAAEMQIRATHDGPVTLLLDTRDKTFPPQPAGAAISPPPRVPNG